MPPTPDIEMGVVNPENVDHPVESNAHSDTDGIVPPTSADETTPIPPPEPTTTDKLRQNHKPWGEHLPEIKGDCWDNVMVAVNKYDDDMVKDWNNDIDTVLIFAGLFSAVVTAFVIESYQWLSEDPSDKTVQILSQLSKQLAGTTNDTSLEGQTPFKVDSRSIRINCFWFLSLLLALSAASAGILAKQWLREYRRDAAMSSKQSFTLRQLRYQSWNKWKVPGIIATLPLLLEFALVLFFAGVLDLLFPLNPILFALASGAIGLTIFFLVITTCAPTLYVCWKFFRWDVRDIPVHNLNPCAFKSPQSLIVFRILYPLAYVIFQLPFSLTRSSWVVFEGWFLELPSRFEDPAGTPGYIKRGLRWMVTNFSDNVGLVKNILHCIDSQATIQEPLRVPVASYATDRAGRTPNLATLLYLRSFSDNSELAHLSVELFVRCVEEEEEFFPLWWSISSFPLSDGQSTLHLTWFEVSKCNTIQLRQTVSLLPSR
ncbi:hypothetical protein C8J56DRAFT_167100 [Mycena floridula]|nr:hypothetical protein C8J56DRAFT_167100 [Mycena floridula]